MGMYGEPRTVVITGPGKTRQSMKDECDINRIVARYAQSGMVTHVARNSPQYVDVSEIVDFRSSLEYVRTVQEFFMKLPAKARARFQNDAAVYLDFMSNADNKAEAVALGLVAPEPAAAVDEVPGPGVQGRGSDGRFTSPGAPAGGG